MEFFDILGREQMETMTVQVPVVAVTNAERLAKAGQVALNVVKASGATVVAGALFGGQIVLFGMGAVGAIYVGAKAIEGGGKLVKGIGDWRAKKKAEAQVMSNVEPASA